MGQLLEETSFLYGANSDFIEDLYSRYLGDPQSVDPSWQNFFAGLGDLVRALNALGASPRDIMSILQALRTAGALHAELIVQ